MKAAREISAAGFTKSKVAGIMNQAAGTAQNLYGQAADVVRQNASPVEAWLRDKIKRNRIR